MLNRVVVCGVGLIGGSFALALKQAKAVGEVVGIGRTHATLDEARRLGVIDRIATDWSDALKGADLVLLATPVGQMAAAFAAMRPHLEAGTVVTDGGSTKCDVVTAARAGLGDRIAQFVPGHPIAGAEKSGVAAAQAGLYLNRKVVLTPLPENAEASVECVRQAWINCGARIHRLSPEEHDGIFAAVSHLPHVLAFALVHDLALRENSAQFFDYAASGFQDFTRIASSHPEMWRDICLANRHALLNELDAYMAELMRVKVQLASGDGAGLANFFATARARREAWLRERNA